MLNFATIQLFSLKLIIRLRKHDVFFLQTFYKKKYATFGINKHQKYRFSVFRSRYSYHQEMILSNRIYQISDQLSCIQKHPSSLNKVQQLFIIVCTYCNLMKTYLFFNIKFSSSQLFNKLSTFRRKAWKINDHVEHNLV